MLDLKSQSQLADSTAAMMRACALALAQSLNVSTSQGLRFWSQVLQPLPAGAAAAGGGASYRGNPWMAWALPPQQGSERPGSAAATLAGPWVGSLLAWQRLARLSVVIPAFWPLLDLEPRKRADALPVPAAVQEAPTFASYRSAGGHASAQVVAPRGQRPA